MIWLERPPPHCSPLLIFLMVEKSDAIWTPLGSQTKKKTWIVTCLDAIGLLYLLKCWLFPQIKPHSVATSSVGDTPSLKLPHDITALHYQTHTHSLNCSWMDIKTFILCLFFCSAGNNQIAANAEVALNHKMPQSCTSCAKWQLFYRNSDPFRWPLLNETSVVLGSRTPPLLFIDASFHIGVHPQAPA